MRPRRSARRLATVLFTDVVGSTTIAAALGDERWQRLLAHHHVLVRRELRRFGGREINTAGDGFLAVFEQPAAALRCAWAISDAVRDIGLDIRAGVHTGEVEAGDGQVGGIAVHIAARIVALAGPREIVASATVRDLTAGSGFEFEDRGSHELKGVPGTWDVVAVVALAGARPAAPLSASVADEARAHASKEPPAGRGGRWTRSVVVASALAVAAVIVVVLVRPNRDAASPPPLPPPGGVLLEVDADTGSVARSVPLSAPQPLGNPGQIAVGEGGVWAIRTAPPGPPGTGVAHFDPADGTLGTTIGTPQERAVHTLDLAVGARSVWVLGAYGVDSGVTAVLQINPATDEIAQRVEIEGEPAGIAAGEGAAWAATAAGEVARLDPHRAGVVTSRSVASSATGVAAGGGALWMLDAVENVLLKLDPRTLNREDLAEIPGSPSGLAVGGARVWVIDEINGTVTSIGTQDGEIGPAIGGEIEQPTDIAFAFGSVWITDAAARSVVRLDPLTGATESIPLGVAPGSLSPDTERGTIWVWAS